MSPCGLSPLGGLRVCGLRAGCLASFLVRLTSQASAACWHTRCFVTLHSNELYTRRAVSVLKKSKVEGKESINSLLFLMRTICVQLKADCPLSHQKSRSRNLLLKPKDSLSETWIGPCCTCRGVPHTGLLCFS